MQTSQSPMHQLLLKPKLNPHEQYQLIEYISTKFIKSLFTRLPYQQIIQHLKPIQWPTNTKIFQQNDKIDHYYFLQQGSVNVYKQTVENNEKSMQIVQNKIGPAKLGENVFNHNTLRLNTLIANQSSKGFIISKNILDQYCALLVKEYKYLKSYLSQFLDISTEKFCKINLDENLIINTSTYGQKIDIQDSIFIVYSGECLMSFQYKPSQMLQHRSNPFKNKANNNKKFKPLLKLCNNQCFGMEKMNQPQFKQNNSAKIDNIRFKYKVSSDKLVYIAIPITKISKFPNQFSVKIQQIHNSHINKLKQNVYYKQSVQDESKTSFIKSRSLSPPLTKRNSLIEQKGQKQRQPNQRQKFLQVSHKVERVSPPAVIKLPHLIPHAVLKSPQKKKSCLRISQKQNKPNYLNNKSYQRNERNTFNDVDVQKLKKNYCIGYDVRKMQPEEINHFKQKRSLKSHNKEPVGYFPIPNRRKLLKQNIQKSYSIQDNSKRRQWVHYIKLPKLSAVQNQ